MSEGGEARNHEAEVEAVARVIYDANRGMDEPWEDAEQIVRDWCLRAARAALDAVRLSPQGADRCEKCQVALTMVPEGGCGFDNCPHSGD